MKNLSCLLLGLLLVFNLAGCLEKETADSAVSQELTTEEPDVIDTSELHKVTDETEISAAVETYVKAADAAKALKNYTVSIKTNAEQESEDTDFNLQSHSSIDIALDETVEGDEKLSFMQSLDNNGTTEAISVYYTDSTIYTDDGNYKLKTPEANYADIDPRFGDVAGALSFDAEAVEGLKASEDDTVVYEFTLDPTKVIFSEVYAMDTAQITSLTVTAEISDGILSNANFVAISESDTKTITDDNKEIMEAQGLSTDEIKDVAEEDAKPVVFTYTVSTMYTEVNATAVEFPDFTEFITQEELEVEAASAEADTQTDSASEQEVVEGE